MFAIQLTSLSRGNQRIPPLITIRWNKIADLTSGGHRQQKRPFYFEQGHPPLFFLFFFSLIVECVFWFWVGRSEKEKKIGKGVWRWDARYLSIISVEPGNNKVWLQSQHRGNGGRKKSTSLLKSNENREKLKICKVKNCLCFTLVYIIGLHAVQFGNNWMKKILRTAKIGRGRRPSPIWQSEEFFGSNYFKLDKHVVLLPFNYIGSKNRWTRQIFNPLKYSIYHFALLGTSQVKHLITGFCFFECSRSVYSPSSRVNQ